VCNATKSLSNQYLSKSIRLILTIELNNNLGFLPVCELNALLKWSPFDLTFNWKGFDRAIQLLKKIFIKKSDKYLLKYKQIMKSWSNNLAPQKRSSPWPVPSSDPWSIPMKSSKLQRLPLAPPKYMHNK
jgi:hypothetical protein